MICEKFRIINDSGLHMRPANEFASAMGAFSSEVTVVYGSNEINGKSLMNLIAAGIRAGSEIEVRCEGEDETEAMEKARNLILAGFGEI